MRYNENMRYNVPSTVPDILYLCGYLKTWLIPSTSLQYSKKELQVLYPQSKAECEQHYKTNTNQIAYNSSEEETIFNESEVAQSCPTLCDPEDCSLPGSSVHGVLQAIILEWVAISFSMGMFPTQGSNPGLPHCRQTLYPLSQQGRFQLGRSRNTTHWRVAGISIGVDSIGGQKLRKLEVSI